MNLSNVNLNEVIVHSDWRDKITTMGQRIFCDAFAKKDVELMKMLLSKNIGFNAEMDNIFKEIVECGDFELLYSIIKDYKNFTNLNYRGECLLNLILNTIVVFGRNHEMSKSKEATIISILKSIDFKHIEGYAIINCLSDYNIGKYLTVLVERGFNFSEYYILQLSSRDGDDCFISEATNGLDEEYEIWSYEVLDRESCKRIYYNFTTYPQLITQMATLYPEQFLCNENEWDNTDSIGFTIEEMTKLKDIGVNFYSFRGDEKYLKYFSVK